jgi:hypothetical protein
VEDSERHKLEVPPHSGSGGSHDAYDTPSDHIDFAIGTTLQGIRNGLLRMGRYGDCSSTKANALNLILPLGCQHHNVTRFEK